MFTPWMLPWYVYLAGCHGYNPKHNVPRIDSIKIITRKIQSNMPSMILSNIVSSVIPLVVIKKILSLLNGIEKYPILFNGHSALFSGYFNGGVAMIFIAFMIIWVNFVSCHFCSPRVYELQPLARLKLEDSTGRAHSPQRVETQRKSRFNGASGGSI
jgi:hypothetical protein